MKKYYNEVWRAFPSAKFEFEHGIIEAACIFSMTGIQKSEFMCVPPSNKQVRIDGMIFFRFKDPKIAE
jgi:predicted ester cyclase